MPSASNKRMRKRKRVDEDGDPEFQVAPMVDVLLVLMLFFMSITSTELLKKDKNLQLSDAKDAKQDKSKKIGEILINVAWSHANNTSSLSLDGLTYTDANSLLGIISGRMKENPVSYVLIRADKDVQYSNIADLMKVCATAGVSKVTFAVIIGGAKKPTATASGNGT